MVGLSRRTRWPSHILQATGAEHAQRIRDLPFPAHGLRALRAALHGERTLETRAELSHAFSVSLDDHQRKFLLMATPIPEFSAGRYGAVAVLYDVTEFARLDELRSELVAVASHELKTPLTTLRMNLLLLGVSRPTLPKVKHFRAPVIYGKSWGEPWYGKNSGVLQRLAAGPDDVELAGGALLAIPGARALEVEGGRAAGLLHKPQRAGGRQDEAQGIGPDHPLVLAALVLPKAGEGIAIAKGDFHRPPLPILGEDRLQTQGEVGGEKRFHGRRGFALPGLSGAAAARGGGPPPRGAGVPAARYARAPSQAWTSAPASVGWGCQPRPFAGERFGGPQQRAFLRGTARGAARAAGGGA